MPGGAYRLKVLLHALVVVDLSWDRNGHRAAVFTDNKLNVFAAGDERRRGDIRPGGMGG